MLTVWVLVLDWIHFNMGALFIGVHNHNINITGRMKRVSLICVPGNLRHNISPPQYHYFFGNYIYQVSYWVTFQCKLQPNRSSGISKTYTTFLYGKLGEIPSVPICSYGPDSWGTKGGEEKEEKVDFNLENPLNMSFLYGHRFVINLAQFGTFCIFCVLHSLISYFSHTSQNLSKTSF